MKIKIFLSLSSTFVSLISNMDFLRFSFEKGVERSMPADEQKVYKLNIVVALINFVFIFLKKFPLIHLLCLLKIKQMFLRVGS